MPELLILTKMLSFIKKNERIVNVSLDKWQKSHPLLAMAIANCPQYILHVC